MRWHGLLGLFLLFKQSTKAEQYIVSKDSTPWLLSSCDLAEPRLVYKNTHFEVAEEIGVLSEAWIGYVSVKVPFLFHGCAHEQKTVQNTYNVTSIGYCQSLCGHHRPFGIKGLNGVDISIPTSVMECLCFNTSVHEIKLGHWDNNQHSLCKIDWFAIFSQIMVNDSWVINSGTGNTGDCLTYRYSGFQWKSCVSTNNLNVICSNKPTADPSDRAKQSKTWVQGNVICLKENAFPASISSIVASRLNAGQQQEYWTGIIREATLINKAGIRLLGQTQYSDAEYAFVKGSEKRLKFVKTGEKQALCNAEESPALGAGIGVLVVVLVVVGIGFAVGMLRRRGIIPACLKNRAPNRTDDKHDDMLPNAASNVARVHKTVVNPNYFVLEKQTETVIEQIDHYNRTEDLENDIIDENIYHSIEDSAAQLRGNVKVDCSDYDCTTDGVATSRGIPHNDVYNKLKLDRQGNYEHVKGSCPINNITTHNDYDTTATLKVISPHGNDDYDHVGDMGHAHALSSIDEDNSSAVKCAAHARVSAA
ncbi:hypothetical protein DPMN_077093 [Dreissena polymorpha]|uniref:WSC domain-containing protein n=1 Tax=Dreissena polymorpha TaxID=45954 RepID=A0A9D4BPA2_DREPO|nr:hypothetical protein DPMN_077093 [Dreissena polymorpha]